MFSLTSKDRDERRRAFVSLLVLGTVTIAAVPYLLVRRRLGALQTELRTTNTLLTARAREMVGFRRTLAVMHEEMGKQRAANAAANTESILEVLGEVKETVEGLGKRAVEEELARPRREEADAKTHQFLEDVRWAVAELQEATVQSEGRRTEREDARYERISTFLRDNDHGRNRTLTSALQAVGRSLGDIAAFMHEMEVRHGYVTSPNDRRGIERMRQLAKELQELQTPPTSANSQVRESLI
ncbi:uncharacterized protein B0H18DRAFT_965318 [Fomitopsis serialis]|uniref:uncharacterized protein n=1 Tax=Fomitopsis serialis TaxID=139415 RepID=UPI0020078E29|nr:uncharacterized protein B0H18DRAFT_965318 [Neoantrodia serialis]KAH9938063.1 hypothetical protein B0H18DRAFT_965318 [Neoantrodia serialis]